jgi:hypothetical protein
VGPANVPDTPASRKPASHYFNGRCLLGIGNRPKVWFQRYDVPDSVELAVIEVAHRDHRRDPIGLSPDDVTLDLAGTMSSPVVGQSFSLSE